MMNTSRLYSIEEEERGAEASTKTETPSPAFSHRPSILRQRSGVRSKHVLGQVSDDDDPHEGAEYENARGALGSAFNEQVLIVS